MRVTYTVASCTAQAFPTSQTVGGQEVTAMVNGLVVELLSDDGAMSHTLRLVPADPAAMAAAQTLYATGAHIQADFVSAS